MHPTSTQKIALTITRGIGSPASIVTHTLIFAASFVLPFLGWINFDRMLLMLTTLLSLEAIYLALFIQMTVNYQGQAIAGVEKDIDEIQEDVEEIQEDVEDIQEDVDELQEDVEEMSEEEKEEEARKQDQKKTLVDIQRDLGRLLQDINHLKDVQR